MAITESRSVFDLGEHIQAIRTADLRWLTIHACLTYRPCTVNHVNVCYDIHTQQCLYPNETRGQVDLKRMVDPFSPVVLHLNRIRRVDTPTIMDRLGIQWILDSLNQDSFSVKDIKNNQTRILENLATFPEKQVLFDEIHPVIDERVKKKMIQQVKNYADHVFQANLPRKSIFHPDHFPKEVVIQDMVEWEGNHILNKKLYRWFLLQVKNEPELVSSILMKCFVSKSFCLRIDNYVENYPELITKEEWQNFIDIHQVWLGNSETAVIT